MDFKKTLQTFLSEKTDLPKLVVIFWPTGSGKTSLSIELAQYLETEIISTDSRQIYTEMNIGTGKISSQEMHNIPHHMIDIISPTHDSYSVGEFKVQAEEIISQIHADKKVPILCGWTGLYIDSIIYDFNIPKIPADPVLRKRLESEASEHGVEYVYQQLQSIDPEYARQVHPNNLNYVIRWIEVKILSWQSKATSVSERTLKYDVLFLTPGELGHDIKSEPYRVWLYERINQRVQQMFDEWLVSEVEQLLQKYWKTKILTDTIGYSEVIQYIEWYMTFDECIALVQQHNRNYAKRQLTWFRKYQ